MFLGDTVASNDVWKVLNSVALHESAPLLPVQTGLQGQAQLQSLNEICGRCNWLSSQSVFILVDENTAYIVKISRLTRWCQDNNVALNVNNTKELIVHFRRSSRDRAPIYINRTPAEQVSEFNFFGITITEDLKWSR